MSLVTHCGARQVTRTELDQVEAPSPTATWYPVKHSQVLDMTTEALDQFGFRIKEARHALTRHNARMFSILDLDTPLATGVHLSVGIRNSLDKSLPLGFCAGSRVFVCDNLAFHSDLMVHHKHTKNGSQRFLEAIVTAVQSLSQFRQTEAKRIETFRTTDLDDTQAESLILRAYEREVISHRHLPRVIQEWREPSYEDFKPRTVWSLFNAFTTALSPRAQTNPQDFTDRTMKLQTLLV